MPLIEGGTDREETDASLLDFRARHGGEWHARYDSRTGRPVLVWGSGAPLVPGRGNTLSSPANPSLEDLERLVREILREARGLHGVADSDLRLQPARSGSYQNGRVWYVDFDRLVRGTPVTGSRVFARVVEGNLVQLGFDRVFESPVNDQQQILTRELALARGLAALGGGGPGDRVVNEGELRFESRVAASGRAYELVPVWHIALQKSGRHETWQALLDGVTGAPIEVFDGNDYGASGRVFGMVNPRTIGDTEIQVPFPLQTVELGGVTAVSDLAGNWVNEGVGPWVRYWLGGRTPEGGFAVENLDGPTAGVVVPSSPTLMVQLWESITPNSTPAERNAFYHLHVARDQARSHIPLPWSNTVVGVEVGSDAIFCNALWDGTGIKLFRANGGCSNNGEIADVIMHEWGHGLDQNTGGGLDKAAGEAVGDITAWLVTRDPVFAPRFQDGANPPLIGTLADPSALRDVSRPVSLGNIAERCPVAQIGECTGPLGFQCHCEGLVLGGAFWDLGVALRQRLGDTLGWERLAYLHYNALPTWTDYTQVADALYAADDDNGNPLDGTPYGCLIDAAFSSHGIGSTPVACSRDYVALELAGTLIEDSAGNGDGILDPGESIALELDVLNAGSAPSVAAAAVVGSLDPALSVLSGDATFPAITAGDTARNLAPSPRFELSPGAACGSVIPVEILLADGATSRRAVAQLTVGRGLSTVYSTGFEVGASGWINAGSASTGSWIAGTPEVTARYGDLYQPGGPRSGVGALYTGARVAWDAIGDGDVDGGAAVAISPAIDLTSTSAPVLQLHYWFVSARAGTQPDDVFQIFVSNGASEVELYRDAGPTRDWRFLSLPLAGRIALTSSMRVRVVANDDVAAGNYVEAAIDDVAIVDFACTVACPFGAVASASGSTDLCEGETTTLLAAVTGCTAPTFQWLRDGVPLAGANGMSYAVPGTVAAGEYRYSVEVGCSASPGCVVRTPPVVVSIAGVVAVVSTPSPLELCSDLPVSLDGSGSAVAHCAGGPIFQWRLNGSPIVGASSPILGLPPGAIASGVHQVTLEVSCASSPRCAEVSVPVLLRVTEARSRLADVGPVFVCVGSAASLDATASTVSGCAGSPSFQWTLGGIDIPGATAPTYRSAPLAEGTYDYGVRVACGAAPGTCPSESAVAVAVSGTVVPTVVDDSLRATRSGSDVRLEWSAIGTGAFQAHRVGRADDLPGILTAPGIAATTANAVSAAGVDPPTGIWLYQVFGADCLGQSYP